MPNSSKQIAIAALVFFAALNDAAAGYVTTRHPQTFAGVPVEFTAGGIWRDNATNSVFGPSFYDWDFNSDGVWDTTTSNPNATGVFSGNQVYLPVIRARVGSFNIPSQSSFASLTAPDGVTPLRVDTTGGTLPAGFHDQAPLAGISGTGACYFDPTVQCIQAVRGQSLTLDGSDSSDPDANVGDAIYHYFWSDSFGGSIATSLDATSVLTPAMFPFLSAIGDVRINLRVVDAFSQSSTVGNDLRGAEWAVIVVRDSPVAAIPEPETYAMMVAGLGLLGFIARRRKRKETAGAKFRQRQ